MARGSNAQRRIASRHYRPTPYPLPPRERDACKDIRRKKCSKVLDKKEWKDVTCSVCMEYPHNAVLLLCSSHDKGCHPYMCGTSYRHSNCLDQYKKAYTKVISSSNGLQDSGSLRGENEVSSLSCPLCRGQVKGWTIVEPARDYLNTKKRSCMQDDCMFYGNYKELKKHVRAKHPSACPRAVDPDHEQKWRFLQREREREDVISTVTSAMPGAVVLGDYVIEGRRNIDFEGDLEEEAAHDAAIGTDRYGRVQIAVEAMNILLLVDSVRQGSNDRNDLSRRGLRQISGQSGTWHAPPHVEDDDNDRNNEGNDDGVSLISHLGRHGNGRVLFGRSGRRSRQGEAYS
ncbi:PREDICTED: uncharacterized protein LOC109333710 isoform X2 [Lupinus angustifolius]|uniref:uncharacterized protein LOC109333710 isoform X2 n=1 Tax=Lupinus angustifolius TaxID=3871 RepID=UPI00092E2FDF|nr:PREDICTED: uncharacterized protein LOC109333710 isoform X2 [Lupinus angustifolius]